MTNAEGTRHVFPCIKCPTSCEVTLVERDGEVLEISGNSCKLGDGYVRKEFSRPERNVTTTVTLKGAGIARLPVRTSCEVPKTAIMDVMAAAASVVVTAPVVVGQVVCEQVAGTSADLVACRSLEAEADTASVHVSY